MCDDAKSNKELFGIDSSGIKSSKIHIKQKQSLPQVSEMTKKDIDTVLTIGYDECYFSATENQEKPSGFWSRETLERWVVSGVDIALVAKNENGVQGFILTTVHLTNRKAECENIWIDPIWRGTEVAQNLMKAMIDRVHIGGSADCIVFLAEYDNKIAQNFVQKKAGFERGKSYVWMVKRIAS